MFPDNKDRRKTILPLLMALVFFGFLLIFQNPMVNNCDYQRVTQRAIDLPCWTASTACIKLDEFRIRPRSTMSLVFLAAIAIKKVIGSDCISHGDVFLLLASLHLIGAFLFLKNAGINATTLVPTFLPMLMFPGFLQSYYEEAVIVFLLPWIGWGIFSLLGRGQLLVFTGTAMLFVFSKAQMVLFIPLFAYFIFIRYQICRQQLARLGLCAVFIAVSGLAANVAKGGNAIPNSYNRIFNGIGWSLQDVRGWPGRSFKERHTYFYAHRFALQSITAKIDPVRENNLFGTSFWPTGDRAFVNNDPVLIDKINESVTLSSYLGFLLENPGIGKSLVVNIYSVLLTSDYSISYLERRSSSVFRQAFDDVVQTIMKFAGFLYVVVFVLIFRICSLFDRIFVTVFFAVMPLAVVGGDGYFEFEKHMIPYFMAIPLIFVLATRLRFIQRGDNPEMGNGSVRG